jgi:hypothetical protein
MPDIEGMLRCSVPILILSAICGWVVNATPWSLCLCERYRIPIVEGAGWALSQVWTCMEKRKFPPWMLETWTLQRIASLCKDYAISVPQMRQEPCITKEKDLFPYLMTSYFCSTNYNRGFFFLRRNIPCRT